MKSIRTIFLFVIFLNLNGCVTTKIVKPEYLITDSRKDIVIITKSGQAIKMITEKYQILHSDTVMTIRGSGTVIKEGGKFISVPFQGLIPFSNIREVETYDKTFFYYSGYYIFGVAVVFVLLLAITFHRQ